MKEMLDAALRCMRTAEYESLHAWELWINAPVGWPKEEAYKQYQAAVECVVISRKRYDDLKSKIEEEKLTKNTCF